MKLSVSTLLIAVVLPNTSFAQPTQRWSQGDPTAEEQQAMEWLNAARKNPVSLLASILRAADSDAIIAGFLRAQAPVTATQFSDWLAQDYAVSLDNSAKFPMSEAISNAPLIFYPLFQQQAAVRGATAIPPATNFSSQRPPPSYIYPVPTFGAAVLNGVDNVFGGPNATGGTAQFGPFGANYAELSQANLYASSIGPREWILSLLIAGYPNVSGSLTPLLRQGDAIPGFTLGHTRMAGLAITSAQDGSRVLTLFRANSEFLTRSDLPFGNIGTVFITGVAYRDQNGNGHYDPGEGLGGIKLLPDKGDWFAVTSNSGGYAIPVAANSGPTILTAQGGVLDGATATVTVGGDNVKLDWVLPPAVITLPPQVEVPASDGHTQLVGLSTRGLVQSGPQALIGGFVVVGSAAAHKGVLIRAVGPSLQAVGIPPTACVPATQLQVYDGAGNLIATNTGWATSIDGGRAVEEAARQVGDFALTNWAGGGGDSALVLTLSPGSYTAAVSPAPGAPSEFQTGHVGLVEIYDLTPEDGSRFVNISTRGFVGPDIGQMIAGWTVRGAGQKRLLVRGVGPALTPLFEVHGALPNPTLTLFDGLGRSLAGNEDWSNSAQTNQIRILAAASGAFALPESGLDASQLVLAAPGNFTAVVGAQPGSGLTGVALVELYETP